MGDAPRMATMHLADTAGSDSLVRTRNEPSAGAAARGGTADVSIDAVDAFADRQRIDRIDLLKLDVEGYELQVLKGAARRSSDGRIRFIYAECVFSPNEEMPHTSFFELHRVLGAAGFCFVTYYADAFYLKRGCSQGNVLYALRSALPASAPGRVRNIV
jgi:hypothetical protein